LTQETLKTPRISTYPVLREKSLQVYLVERGDLDDALQALPGRWDTPAGTHKGQKNKEKFDQVHPH